MPFAHGEVTGDLGPHPVAGHGRQAVRRRAAGVEWAGLGFIGSGVGSGRRIGL